MVDQAPPAMDLLRVFESQFDYVYRTLRRYGLSAADAEDLSQEVFVIVWRRRQDYDRDRPLRPWIAGIIFRLVQRHRRLRAREVLADDVDAPDEAPGPDEQLATAHARRLVLRALAAVPVKQRVVLVMHDLDGATIREISDALAVSRFTLYDQLKAGREAFAREVRRAQLVAAFAADLAAADPGELLARERTLPAAPGRARERIRQRLKAVVLLPAGRPREPSRSGGLSWLGGALLASAVLFAVLALRAPVADSHELSAAADRAPSPPSTRAASLSAVLGRALAAPKIAMSLPPARKPGPPTLLRGLLGYWRFEDGPGSALARDRSGGGSDCVLRRLDQQTAWAEGPVSGALTLDGKGWLECPHTEQLGRLDSELTIAAWVKRGSRLRNHRVVVARQMDGSRLDDFFLGFANGDLMFSSHVFGVRMVRPLPPHRDVWFHIAATRADDGTARLYVDGVEVDRQPSPPATLAGRHNPLVIGASFNDPASRRAEARFDGAIDELLIYHRALAADEVQALAASRLPPLAP